MKHKKQSRVPVKPHTRAPRGTLPPKRPMPGPNEFSPDQESAMRAGSDRNMGMGPPAGPPAGPPLGGMDEDLGGM